MGKPRECARELDMYKISVVYVLQSVGYMLCKLTDDGVYHIYELEIFREYRLGEKLVKKEGT